MKITIKSHKPEETYHLAICPYCGDELERFGDENEIRCANKKCRFYGEIAGETKYFKNPLTMPK